MLLGVDVGATKTLAVLCGKDGRLEDTWLQPTPPTTDELVGLLVSLVGRWGSVASTGICVPGRVTPDGTVTSFPNLPDVDGEVMDARMNSAVPHPVRWINDANAAALAEWRVGAARDTSNSVTLSVGTGIGAGVVIDGSLRSGHSGALGEVGHLPIGDQETLCGCGLLGCWETVASGQALLGVVTAVLGPKATVGDLLDAASGGQPAAQNALAQYCGWLAQGVVALSFAYDPELVVLGGGVFRERSIMLGLIESALHSRSSSVRSTWPRLVESLLGPTAAAVGAAIFAADLKR